MAGRVSADYVLPLRWANDAELDELTRYLRRLSGFVDVTVVDGSDPTLFRAHAAAWAGLVRHVPPEPLPGANGKVRGVLTGLGLARHEAVVIADDDVRYERRTLAAVVAGLSDADLVRPQNFFAPAPWHARWDTGRILLNRAVGHDFPGTYAVRRSTLASAGGYSADVLFENLEMERTVIAAGGRVADRPDLLVPRRPPSTRHFLSQRVRQAYDSQAQPGRLLLEAALVPILVGALRRGLSGPTLIGGLTLGLIALAEWGRRRAGGRAVFPASSALWAPLWMSERCVCTWFALALRLRGGVRYAGGRLAVPAHSVAVIRARRAARSASAAGQSRPSTPSNAAG